MKPTKPMGGYWEKEIQDCGSTQTNVNWNGNEYWIPARPLPYYSWRQRLRLAWDVLTYKADAVYWMCDQFKNNKS